MAIDVPPHDTATKAAGPRRRIMFVLLAILALAAALRWGGLMSAGFFFDELWNVEDSNGYGSSDFYLPFDRVIELDNPLLLSRALPVWRLPSTLGGITHPPAAFVSLRLWRDAFGDGMFALRSWSAAWSMLSVALVFAAGRRSFGAAAGLWAALLCAVSLGSIDQAQDVRGYSMMQAVTLLTVLALLRLREGGRTAPAAIALGAGAFLMMSTHYYCVGPCAAIAAAAVALLRGAARRQAIVAIAIAGLLWSIWWLSRLREQLAVVAETADIFLADDSPRPVVATLLRLIAAPYTALVGDPATGGVAARVGGLILWLAVAYRLLRRADGDRAAMTWLWSGLAAGALAPQLVLDVARHTMHLAFPRYVVAAVPPLCVLLGSLPTIGPLPSLGRGVALPAVVAAGLAVAYAATTPTWKPDLRPQIAYLQQQASPGDLILLPALPDRGLDARACYLYVAYGLRWDRHRVALPVGPQSREWVDALPRDGRWFCVARADYQLSHWLPGLAIVDRGPVHLGVAVYEVRRAGAR